MIIITIMIIPEFCWSPDALEMQPAPAPGAAAEIADETSRSACRKEVP